ncbi:hypothetical protein FPQ18DRAFT_390667 [Pyronema domesticum]|nr:hypothetical protein FPQ18DRAFT_390667 [Pyronema domesticum]
MSDNLRKPFSDRVEEKVTPDSSKSTVDRAKESVTTTADKSSTVIISVSGTPSTTSNEATQPTIVMDKGTDSQTEAVGEMQPDSTKSTTQEGFDKGRREKDSIGDKIKHAVGMDSGDNK